MPVIEIKKIKSEIEVKIEPEDDYEVIACDPRGVKSEPVFYAEGSWPRLEVHIEKLNHGLSIEAGSGSSTMSPYSCDICGSKAPNRTSMYQHLRYHHLKAGTFCCTLCSKAFSKNSSLEYHMKSKHFKIQLKCKVCDFQTTHKQHLKKHEISHTSRAGCPVCRRPVPPRLMESHLSQHSDGYVKPPPKSCEICGKLCTTSSALSIHWKKCHFSTHGPRNVWTLKNKKISSSPKKSSLLQCDICGKSFQPRSLLLHMRLNHMLEKRHFSCNICDYKTSFKQNLTKHKQDHLTKQECKICRKPYSERFMVFHMKSHSQITGNHSKKPVSKKRTSTCPVILQPEDPYTCDCCSKTFGKRSSLVSHVKNHANLYLQFQQLGTGPQAPTACPCCYKTIDINILDKHIEKTHRRHNFKCRECEETFLYSEKLRIHSLKTHYDGQLHECHCGSVYRNKYDLNYHQKAHDPPVTCGVCSRIFEDKESLNLHWRFRHFYTHGALKDLQKTEISATKDRKPVVITRNSILPRVLEQKDPYTCDFCGKAFESRSLFVSHVKHHVNLYLKFQQLGTGLQVPTTCPCCYKTFDVNILDKHIEKTHRRQNFKCGECDETFLYSEKLRIHSLKTHYDGELHECHCGSVYRNEKDLNHHQKAHDPPTTCGVCKRIFEDRGSLYLHWRFSHFYTHGAFGDWQKSQLPKIEKFKTPRKKIWKFPIAIKHEGPYTCDVCGQDYLHRNAIYSHLKYSHFRTTTPSIRRRDKRRKSAIRRPKKVKNIMLSHRGPYSCDKCGRKQKTRSTFLKHLAYMHGTKNLRTKNLMFCDLCPSSFTQKHRLAYHLKRSHFTDKKVCECPDCGKTFLSKRVMQTHRLESHYGGILFRCHCGSVFKDRSGLKQHSSVHDIAKYECELCSFRSKHRGSLHSHWKIKHFESKGSYVSWRESMGVSTAQHAAVALKRIDSYIFDQEGNLLPNAATILEQIHFHKKVQVKIEGQPRKVVKPDEPQVTTACPCCYKMFDVNILAKHIEKTHRRHNFKCRECDETFLYSEKLRIHSLKTHYDGELHECHCGAVYKHKKDLNRHQNAHDPPITCGVCKRIFVDRESLYRHWKTWHFNTHGSFNDWSKIYKVKTDTVKAENVQKFPVIIKQKGPYTCDVCGKQCKNRGSVITHLRYSHFLAPFLNCEQCPASFNMKSLLQSHIQRHHGVVDTSTKLTSQLRERKLKPVSMKALISSEDHTCRECGEAFKFKRMLNRHFLKNHYDGNIFECHCGAVYKKKEYLQIHKLLHNEAAWHCEVCDIPFRRRLNLYTHWKKLHSKTHGNRSAWRQSMGMSTLKQNKSYESYPALNHPGPYSCDICGTMHKSRASIIVHLKYRHFLENFLFCDLCPKSFNMKSTLESHLKHFHLGCKAKTKKAKTIREHCCPDCDESFPSFKHLRDHVLRNHYSGDLHECHCGQLFKTRERLKEHSHIHSAKYDCELCGKTLKCQRYMYPHWAMMHAAQHGSYGEWKAANGIPCKENLTRLSSVLNHKGPYTCDLCGHLYSNRQSFSTHLSAVHLRPKTKQQRTSRLDGPQVPTTCPCCYKTFDANILDKHIRKTHRRHNFKCRECDETFLYSEKLRIHSLEMHYDGELHECHCGAVYKNEYDLNHHQKAHDPPVTCGVCSRIFADKDCLYRHWKIRHYGTHGGFGEWRKNQMAAYETSNFLIVDIKSGWDGLDSDFDGESYLSGSEFSDSTLDYPVVANK